MLARGGSALLTLVAVAVLMVLTRGLFSIGLRRTERAFETQGELMALFAGDSGVEEAKMRLSPGAPAAARFSPGGTPGWRAYILSGHTRAEVAAGLDPTYGLSQASGYTRPEPTVGYVFAQTVQNRAHVRWSWVRIEHKVNGSGRIVSFDPTSKTETTAAGHPPVLLVTARGDAHDAGREVRAELRPAMQAVASGVPGARPLSAIPPGLANLGSLRLQDRRVMVLSEGTYWFSSLSITDDAQLQIRGAVTLYVTGPIQIAGDGIRTSRGVPADLRIYGTADPRNPSHRSTVVRLDGGGRFHGGIDAPEAEIIVRDVEVFGALVGRSVSLLGRATLQADASLADQRTVPPSSESPASALLGYTRHLVTDRAPR